MATYCGIDDIKVRVLIALNDTQYDDALNNAANEATSLVDVFLTPYATTPLTNPTGTIVDITADFGASIFKRRMFPQEVELRGPQTLAGLDTLTQMDATGWFALGLKKLEVYIRNAYVLVKDQMTSVYNPEIYIELFQRGLITGKEARELVTNLSNNSTIYIKRIEEIQEYKTKKQKSFVWVKSDKDSGYEEYNK